MKKVSLKFKTLILSDVHLGMADCKINEVNHLLKHAHCEKLILNGDIIDGLALKRGGRWTKKHTRFIRLCLKKMEKKRTEIVYIRGNHDDILSRFLPLRFDKLTVTDKHVHETPNGNYLCIHGDGLDAICSHHKWLMHLGNLSYDVMLWINRMYNKWRIYRGKDYFSISKIIKAKVKGAVAFVGKYEDQLQNLARKQNYKGIIAGHIHTPADKMVGKVHYLNSGDWLESETFIVEHFDNTFEVIDYQNFLMRLEVKAERKRQQKENKMDIVCIGDDLPPEEEDEESEVISTALVEQLVKEKRAGRLSRKRARRDSKSQSPASL